MAVSLVPPGQPRRLVRLLVMRDLIARQPGIQRRMLASQFRVSERRIQDDLLILQAAGVPVERRATGGYSLRGASCT